MTDPIAPRILREAERLGARNLRIRHTRRHPRIEGLIGGERFSLPFPNTPSDWRSERNQVAQLRRFLRALAPGVVEPRLMKPCRAGRRRKNGRQHKGGHRPVTGAPLATRSEDRFYAPLRALRELLGAPGGNA